jgi:hypothetical protein
LLVEHEEEDISSVDGGSSKLLMMRSINGARSRIWVLKAEPR